MNWLKRYPGSCHSIVLDWLLGVAGLALQSQRNKYLRNFAAIAAGIRQEQIQVEDAVNLPLPYQYFQIMNLMLFTNFSMWAYGMGMYDSWIASFIFVCSLLIFLGMKELSACLSDPFGDDAVDFPLNRWIEESWRAAHFFLESDCPDVTMDPRNFEDAPPLWQGKSDMNVYLDMEEMEQAWE